MTAPRCISMFFKERAAASKRYQFVAASERKRAAIFCVVAASRNISMFFNKRAAASERYQ